MKKLLKIFLVIFVVSALLATFAACKPNCKGQHTYNDGDWHDAVAATCTEDGSIAWGFCSVCKKYYDAEGTELPTPDDDPSAYVVAALGHRFTTETPIEDAGSCVANGQTAHYHCDRCNKDFAPDKTTVLDDVSVVGPHSKGEWIPEVPATCTKEGTVGHYECSVCHKWLDDEGKIIADDAHSIAKVAHTLTKVDAKAADCTNAGNNEYWQCTADGCGKVFKDAEGKTETTVAAETIAALGHTYNKEVVDEKYLASAATCTKAATYYKSCSCGAKGTETFTSGTALGHSFTNYVSNNDATCTADGTKTATCDRCTETDKIADVGSAKGHSYGDLVPEKPSDCGNTGTSAHYECSACHALFDAEKNPTTAEALTIPVNGAAHNFEHVVAVPSTCTKDGNVEHWHCSACEGNFSDEAGTTALKKVEIAALGHDIVENVCQREGCGKELTAQEIVDALYALATNKSLEGTYKLTGVITEVNSAWSEQYSNITVTITVCEKTIQCYRLVSTEGFDASTLTVGCEITVVGTLKNYYNNVKEFDSGCKLVGLVKPTYTLTVPTVEHATVTTLETSYEAGSIVSFTVTPDAGYKVAFVKVNGETLLANDDGSYSFAITTDTEIDISIVGESVPTDTTVLISIADVADAGSWVHGTKYNTLPTVDENLTITASTGNNNGKYWVTDYGDQWRLFSSDKGTITFTVADGYELVSISMKFAISDTSYFDKISATDQVYTVTADEKSSVTFTVTKGKIFIYTITVVYRPATPACTHENATKTEAKEATCAAEGNNAYWTCSDCGKVFKDAEFTTETTVETETIAALGHTYNKEVADAKYIASAATCTAAATYYKSCTCGEKGTETFTSGTALGHSFTNYVSNNDATCTADGTKTATCDREDCSETDTITDVGSKLEHSYGAWSHVEDTETHTHACTRTGCTHTETEDCTIGSWQSDSEKHWKTCSVCSHKYNEATHSFSKENVCECGANYNSVTATFGTTTQEFKTLKDAIDWAVENYNATTPVTITLKNNLQGDGIKVGSESGAKANVIIDLDDHTYTVNANTVGSKNTETNAFQLLKGSTVTFKNGTIDTVAEAKAKILIQNYCDLTLDNVKLDGTKLVPGYFDKENQKSVLHYVSSNNCGNVVIKNNSQVIGNTTNYIVALDLWYGMSANYDDGVTVTIESGSVVTDAIEYGAASRVTGTDWIVKTKLVINSEAMKLGENFYVHHSSHQDNFTCDQMNVTVNDQKVACTYGNYSGNTATCTEGGTEKGVCIFCYNVDTRVTDALGHVKTHHDAKPASCTEDGTVEYWSCSRCTTNFSDEACTTVLTSIVDAAKGHTWDSENIHPKVDSTCTSEGNVEYWYCTACKKYFAADEKTVIEDIKISIDENAHGWGDWSHVEGTETHSRTCSYNSKHVETVDCSYNDAHVCTACNATQPQATLTIGETTTSYATVALAAAALPTDGTQATIKLNYSCQGDGIKIVSGNNVIFDLNNFTYTVNANTVGSEGTETNAFQLLKGSTVTFKNGTIDTVAEAKATRLIQNYCDLTFENVTVDGTDVLQDDADPNYVSSNNCGTIVYKNGSKVIATGTNIAFDVWYGMSEDYEAGVSVTVEDGCTIEGPIEYGAKSRITGTDWTAKATLVLPALAEGSYDIRFSSSQEGLTCSTANITIGGTRYACAYGAWLHVEGTETHSRTCNLCGHVETASCSGGTATCTAKATCSDCGTQYGTLAEHNYGTWIADSATCTAAGNVAHYECFVCQDWFNAEHVAIAVGDRTSEAKGHTWDNGGQIHTEVPATCTEAGTQAHWHCTECGKNFDDDTATELTDLTIDKIAHNPTHHAAKDATCAEEGNVEYWSCSACEGNFSDEACTTPLSTVTKEKLAHVLVANACKNCDYVMSESEILEGLSALPTNQKNAYLINSTNTYKLTGTITKIEKEYASGKISFWIKVGETDIEVYQLTCDADLAEQLIVDTKVTVTGKLLNYYKTTEFASDSTVVVDELPTLTITWADISNGKTSGYAIDGTQQESRPSSVTALQSVSFKVVPNEGFKVASVKVNDVAVEADDDGLYAVKVKENITITVAIIGQNEAVAQEYNKTFVIADIASENGWTNQQKITTLVSNDIFTIATITGTNTGKYYSNDSTWRLYSSESATVTIKVSSFYKLVSVSVEFSEGGFDKITKSEAVFNVKDDTSELVLTATAKTCVTSITVNYKEAVACDHEWGDGEVTKAATCKEVGERTYTCSKCSLTRTEEISVSETHTFGEGKDEVPATCTAEGTVAHNDCTVCGKHFDNSNNEISDEALKIEALGHSFVDGVCSRCGAEEGAAETPSETTVSQAIKDIAETKKWSNATQYDEIELDTVITVTANGGDNAGKFYTNGNDWRLYQTGKDTVTISAKDGYTIVSVKITYNIGNNGTLLLNTDEIASENVVTVNSSSVTFSVGNTGTKTNGQVRITAIEVVYLNQMSR